MNLLFDRPRSVFALLIAGAFMVALATHGFRAQTEPDSDHYIQFDWSSLEFVLSDIRTWGYPLFIRSVLAMAPDINAVAVAQWLCWLMAAICLYRGLVVAGCRRYFAAWAAGILLYGHAPARFTPTILADSLAASFSVCAAGAFLASSRPHPTRRTWAVLTVTTFASWIVRPAYLFLIPLWPLLSVFFSVSFPTNDQRWCYAVRRGVTCGLMTVLPFVLYCTLRWSIVGHWGVVSFGGYNIIGIAGQLLEERDLDVLPRDLQPLARKILERRPYGIVPTSPTDYLSMESRFNPTVWQLAVPVAREQVGEDSPRVNALLSRLASELLRLHCGQYLLWLLHNLKHAIQQVLNLLVIDRGTLLIGLLLLGIHLMSLFRPRGDRLPPSRTCRQRSQVFAEDHLLLWTALAFTAAKVALVILVEPAIGRYVTSAMVLLPSAFAIFFAKLIADEIPHGPEFVE